MNLTLTLLALLPLLTWGQLKAEKNMPSRNAIEIKNSQSEEETRQVFTSFHGSLFHNAVATINTNPSKPLPEDTINLIKKADNITLAAIINKPRLAQTIFANQKNIANLNTFVSTYMAAYEHSITLLPNKNPNTFAAGYIQGIIVTIGLYNAFSYINSIVNVIANVLNLSSADGIGTFTSSFSMANKLLKIYADDVRKFLTHSTPPSTTPTTTDASTNAIPQTHTQDIETAIRNASSTLKSETQNLHAITYATGVKSNLSITSNIANIIVKNLNNNDNFANAINTVMIIGFSGNIANSNNHLFLAATQDSVQSDAQQNTIEYDLSNSTNLGTINFNTLDYPFDLETVGALAIAFAYAEALDTSTFFKAVDPSQSSNKTYFNKKDYIALYATIYLDQKLQKKATITDANTYTSAYTKAYLHALNHPSNYPSPFTYAISYASLQATIKDPAMLSAAAKSLADKSQNTPASATLNDVIQGITQITSLTPDDISSMLDSLKPFQLSSLSANQIQSLSMELLEKILAKTTLSADQIQALTPTQLSQLTTEQLQSMASSLSADQIKSLPLKQVQDLPTVAATQTIKDFSIAQVAFNTEASKLIQKILDKLSLIVTGLPQQEIGNDEGKGPWLVTWDQSEGTLGYTHEQLTVSEQALQQARISNSYNPYWYGR